MIEKTGRFRRSDRLRRSRDFQRVSRVGGRVASRYFIARTATGVDPKAGSALRLGITASRGVGNAVVRNRIKRLVREWFRRSGRDLLGDSGETDLVIIARRPVSKLAGKDVLRELDVLATRMETAR